MADAVETAEKRELKKFETIVRNGIKSYITVGNALKSIQDKKLYKQKHPTFDTYCEKVWGFTRSAAYGYLHAVEVVESVHSNVQIPQTKALALYPLKTPEERKKVIEMDGFATMTVRELIAEVKKRLPQPEPTGEPTPEQKVIHLVTTAKKEFSSAIGRKDAPASLSEYDKMISALEAALAELRQLKTVQTRGDQAAAAA